MKCLIVVYSYHHHNTEKAAKTFAKVLGAQLKTPQQTNPDELIGYNLVGFGLGQISGKHSKPLLDFADQLLPITTRKPSFSQPAKFQTQVLDEDPYYT